ncbi:MAG TPA: recombinase RecT [Actinomycetota bacterium]|nr:recombinase RecT [Actinomycetota bacterium]
MTGTEIAERTPQQELVARVRSPQFRSEVELALPGGVTPDRFVRIAITALNQNPDIAGLEKGSVFTALLKAAADGLLPDGKEAALVGFGKKAQYMPMIAGLRKIAGEHGWSIRTSCVYSGDVFEYELGLEPRLVHRPATFGESRGELIGAYAVGTGPAGQKELVVLDRHEIEKVRNVSRAAKNGPWVEWTDAMYEKTAGRNLFKKLPLGERDAERIARVVEASEVDPGEATALLYETSSQQAASSESVGRAVPGSDDEPGPAAPEKSAAGPALDAETASAALVEMPSGKWKGTSVGDIADAEGGLDWFLWMLKDNQPRRFDDHDEHLVYLAARKVAEARFPELLQ